MGDTVISGTFNYRHLPTAVGLPPTSSIDCMQWSLIKKKSNSISALQKMQDKD